MNSSNDLELIGKMVLSSAFGVGTIVGTEELSIDEKTFLVIESEGQRVKHYVPLEDENTYRLISSEEEIKKILKSLKRALKLVDFESKKDRINYFRETSKVQDIDMLAKLLRELNGISDCGTIEKQIFSKIRDTIALEYSLALKIELNKAQELVDKALEGEKK